MLIENVVVWQIEKLKVELDEMLTEHNKMKLSINSRLSQRQKEQEQKTDKNNKMELRHSMDLVDFRSRVDPPAGI